MKNTLGRLGEAALRLRLGGISGALVGISSEEEISPAARERLIVEIQALNTLIAESRKRSTQVKKETVTSDDNKTKRPEYTSKDIWLRQLPSGTWIAQVNYPHPNRNTPRFRSIGTTQSHAILTLTKILDNHSVPYDFSDWMMRIGNEEKR
jgi:hypothetical protein